MTRSRLGNVSTMLLSVREDPFDTGLLSNRTQRQQGVTLINIQSVRLDDEIGKVSPDMHVPGRCFPVQTRIDPCRAIHCYAAA